MMGANMMTGKYHWKAIRLLIQGKRMTTLELSEAVECRRAHMDNVVRAMREAGLIYVCGYKDAVKTKAMVWALRDKDQEDVPRPERMPNAVRCDRNRNKKKVLSGDVRIGIWGL